MAGVAAGVVVIGGLVAFFVLGEGDFGSIPIIGEVAESDVCPMSGRDPGKSDALDRPAVAVKVENAEVAYPLSGLQDAEIVYEEVVEGGVTRFMALYHCSDSSKIGPVRSARVIDPAIMQPKTRILAYSGENRPVLKVLQKADVVRITEDSGGNSMRRIPREGLTSEHTLYANSARVRAIGQRKFEDAPDDDLFAFGKLEGNSPRARTIDIRFSGLVKVRYQYSGGGYRRFQPTEQRFIDDESGKQVIVDNVLIEEHEVNNSKTIVDVQGNPSTEIEDETGKGRAVLFRDGKAIVGSWSRGSLDDPTKFETRSGDEMVFAPGSIWIHLVPSKKGEVKGSFSFR
jgi:hypothetical protein